MCEEGKRALQSLTANLVPIQTVPARLLYAEQGLAGAMPHPFAASETVRCLEQAARYLREHRTARREIALLIWDAYRTPETQDALYRGYVRQLMDGNGLTEDEALARAGEFVCPPSVVFPHGTGGAVDVTLTINGEEAPMGTAFDDFVPEAASDWYRDNPPRTAAEESAAANRALLRAAMETAGFVGLSSEWWHFEWGTARWGRVTGQPPILTRVPPPHGE